MRDCKVTSRREHGLVQAPPFIYLLVLLVCSSRRRAAALIRVRRNEAIVSAVTRDSNIHTWPNYGIVCWFIPDQCMNLVRFFILISPQAEVPVLQMSARPQSLPETDCSLVMDKRHSEFLYDAAATRAAVLWAQGKDPCAMAGPTPTPEPDDCRWWKWLFGWCR
jgi:hypothetical protein